MFTEKIASLWDQLKVVFSDFAFTDFLDICLVAFILYSVIKLIRETKAIQLAKGLLLFGVAYLAIYLLDMQASEFIFKKVFGEIIIVLVIQSMSESKTGSLIVFEHDTLLGDIIKSGTPVDAIVSRELIGNIFYHGAPLHDGAAVIRDGRVVAAGCVLPLTQKENLDTQLGTRHRAAIGMSEQGDAMIVVTSEETGTISIACKGQLIRNLTDSDLREHLVRYLCGTNNEDKAAVKGIRKLFGGFKK